MTSLRKNSSGAGYQPAAAHRAALVFNTEKRAESRLAADSILTPKAAHL
jgi:hypothetical protein